MKWHISDLFPTILADDVFSIDYTKLFSQGYRALLFDIDNTLVPHGKQCTEDVRNLFRRLHSMGFKTILVSNNGEKRIAPFASEVDSSFIAEAGKPSPECFLQGAKMLDMDIDKAIMIGDTIRTDILGANRAGMNSILVKYIGHEKREWKGLYRYLESIILLAYRIKPTKK